MSDHKIKIPGRTAAVLTTSAVAASAIQVGNTATGQVQVYVDFTIGSLTNGIVTPQLSDDNSTWYDVTSPGALTLTADGAKAFSVDCGGAKYFRVTCKGTGTVTGSSMAVRYGFCSRVTN